MTPVWSPEAIDDLAALRAYIEQDNPAAAQRVVLRIIENVETLLPNNHEMGRPGRVPGSPELVIPMTPFIVPYRLVGNTLQILRIYHGARRWAERFLNNHIDGAPLMPTFQPEPDCFCGRLQRELKA
jgi:toxin ParE1/3/4